MQRKKIQVFIFIIYISFSICKVYDQKGDKNPIVLIKYSEHGIGKRSIDDTTTQAATTVEDSTATEQSTTTRAPDVINMTTDHHIYYSSRTFSDPKGLYWNELQGHTRHSISDDEHKILAFLPMSFEFPFYGHLLDSFAMSPLGFLYMHSFTHPSLDYTYTHYIAPLMANFDTIGNHSDILYKDDGNSLVIEWRNVGLNDQEEHGNYTFQTTLYKNGTIMFVYKEIPETNISSENFPVKIGISDAYYYDMVTFLGTIRYIIKYHSVEFNVTDLKDNLVIIIDPLPTCNLATTCNTCTTLQTDFSCSWCHAVSRCSDGIDRYTQDWLQSDCTTNAVDSFSKCTTATVKPPSSSSSSAPNLDHIIASDDQSLTKSSKSEEREGAKKTATIVVPMVVAVGLIIVFIVFFVVYARANPTSKSGQWLIKHRPSKWKENFSTISFSKNPKEDKLQIQDLDNSGKVES